MEWTKKMTTKDLVNLSMLVALNVIFSKFLTFDIGLTQRIGFGFIPVAISGAMYGPLLAGLAAVVADLLRMTLFPGAGSFHLGFTLNAFLTAFVYGMFFYQQYKSILVRNIIANLIIMMIINSGLNTLWLSQMYGMEFFELLTMRIGYNAAMFGVRIVTLQVVYAKLMQRIRLHY